MDLEELKKIVNQGEDSQTQFKEDIRRAGSRKKGYWEIIGVD